MPVRMTPYDASRLAPPGHLYLRLRKPWYVLVRIRTLG